MKRAAAAAGLLTSSRAARAARGPTRNGPVSLLQTLCPPGSRGSTRRSGAAALPRRALSASRASAAAPSPPPPAPSAPPSPPPPPPAAGSSVVEAALAARAAASRRAAELSIALDAGDTLLYVGGAGTARTVRGAWLGSGALWAYVLGAQALTLVNPTLVSLWSAPFLAAWVALAGASTALALASSASSIRAAALTADGAHLRLWAYGPLGVGLGAPVDVPLAAASAVAPPRSSAADASSVFVAVGSPSARLLFDKPELLPYPRDVVGTGVQFSERGVVLGRGGLPAGWGAGAPGELAALPPAAREELRRYCVLALALTPGVGELDAAAVAAGAWELADVKDATRRGRHGGPRERAVGELALWRRAIDGRPGANGREYWYHELTWATAWAPPRVDGRGPFEHWPARARLPARTVVPSPMAEAARALAERAAAARDGGAAR